MNREIKFRFWEISGSVMIDWLTVRQTAFNRGETNLCYTLMGTDPNYIKMQFTGLHDKNGKEIYEGDICRWPSGHLSLISWNESRACFNAVAITQKSGVSRHGIVSAYIEVIGNEYQHKHLLENIKP